MDQSQKSIDLLVLRVEKLTALALSGPEGLKDVFDQLGSPVTIGPSVGYTMRDIARHVLPANYEFEIREMFGGQCRLYVTSIR